MQKTIYSCDKCKKNVSESSDLLAVCIDIKGYSWDSKRLSGIRLDLCQTCREKAGISKRVITEEKIVEEPATTKDKLYDVICALIQETGIQIEY